VKEGEVEDVGSDDEKKEGDVDKKKKKKIKEKVSI
jgi:hypothetical protein